jgi:hypothetical protein|uniref:Uncharacterized protein n=1 Tax=uncultured marine virus TaxID=186617 RepID=A0A0F7L4E6_9VIRU|nr:hypothetical protein [uncultured marine virus]|tara:strand:+ start:860 stop:1051 length:192 start_codon:yes stop_codon:yes gene_type:complete
MATLKESNKTNCFNCKNFNEFQGNCKAFLNGIPYGVGTIYEHLKPLPGQNNNIVFEPGEPNQN